MKNAEKFKTVFGLYATEVWSMPEDEFLRWLNSENTEIEQDWIPVSNRLPRENNFYLTSTMFDEVYLDEWNGNNWERTEEVLAWMPKPKPYRGSV